MYISPLELAQAQQVVADVDAMITEWTEDARAVMQAFGLPEELWPMMIPPFTPPISYFRALNILMLADKS